jgi:hypothetical protein
MVEHGGEAGLGLELLALAVRDGVTEPGLSRRLVDAGLAESWAERLAHSEPRLAELLKRLAARARLLGEDREHLVEVETGPRDDGRDAWSPWAA